MNTGSKFFEEEYEERNEDRAEPDPRRTQGYAELLSPVVVRKDREGQSRSQDETGKIHEVRETRWNIIRGHEHAERMIPENGRQMIERILASKHPWPQGFAGDVIDETGHTLIVNCDYHPDDALEAVLAIQDHCCEVPLYTAKQLHGWLCTLAEEQNPKVWKMWRAMRAHTLETLNIAPRKPLLSAGAAPLSFEKSINQIFSWRGLGKTMF
jgi:hypothetical protein